MALELTRKYPTIDSATDAGIALDQYIDGDIDQLYANDNELYNGNVSAKGVYSTLDDRLTAIEESLTSPPGLIKYGTNAERLAYTPSEGMRWLETDTGRTFVYDTTLGWIELVSSSIAPADNKVGNKTLPTGDIVGTTDIQTLTNKTLDAATLTGANSVTGTITVPEPSTDNEPTTKSYVDLRLVKGFITGLYPVYNSSTQIDIAPGVVWIGGKVYELTSTITLTPTLTASSWHYIYVSSSPAAQTLAATDFYVSTAAPSRSSNGWYDANGNRCIGFFYADSTPAIVNFYVSGKIFELVSPLQIYYSTTPPAGTLTAVATGFGFQTEVMVNAQGYDAAASAAYVHLQPGYTTTLYGNSWAAVCISAAGATAVRGACAPHLIQTDTNGNINFWARDASGGALDQVEIRLWGIGIPDGMGRP